MLENNFKAVPDSNTSEIKVLQHHNDEKNVVIVQMRDDNTALAQACKEKDDHIANINQIIADLKNKNEKQKKLLASQKKTKKQLREHQKDVLKLKKQINEKEYQLTALKDDLQKRVKEKEIEVGRLKNEVEVLKNKSSPTIQNADLKGSLGKINGADSHSSHTKEPSVHPKPANKKSERERSSDSKNHETTEAKIQNERSPKAKVSVAHKEEASASNSKVKSLKELKHVIYQLNCKINEHSLELKEFINKIIFKNDDFEKSIESAELTACLKHFMSYSHPNEIDDLVKLL